jgi:dihydrofolate reductase
MSMSVDGYIAGPNDEPSNPGGDEFMRLHDWYATETGSGFMDQVNATGAVLSGRRTVEQVDHWGGDHHGVPIFVVSHRPPDPAVARFPAVTYVADIAGGMAQAKALEAGVLDEIQIHQIPVLFGSGRRLFDVLPARIELDIVRVLDTPDATHIRYRVRR